MEPLGDGEHPIAGAFRIVAELARGGMGRVLLGVSPDGRLVAVKLVHAEFGDDHDFRSRFRREVAASRRVSGAYTAAVLDADPDAPLPWLASVFVPGPSLQQVVDRGGPLPTEALVRLAAGLAAALTEIHRVGLIHRDLKPSNVLLATDGPRVIDFGIARAPDDDGTRITHTGLTVGSPGFMSPEQAESSEITTASDMFSLGAVLVHAASGRSPFARSAPLQTLYSIVHEEADLTALPAELRGLVARCLSKDPAHRPTPAQFGEQLRQLPPTLQPWPAGVHDMIEAQHAEVARLLGLSETGTVTVESGTGRVVGTAAGGERTALVPGHPSSTPPLPSGPPGSPAADERAEPQEARPGSAFGPPVGPYADVTPPGAPNTGPPTGSADSNTWPGDTPRDRVPPGYLPIGAETDQVPGKPTERPRRLGRRAILFGAVGGIGALVGIPLAARLAGSSAAENAAPPPSDPPPSSSPDAPLPPGAPGVLERTSTYVLSTPIANGGPIVTAYSPDGELLALGDQRSGLILLDSSTLEVDTVLVKPGARVTWEGSGAVAFSPDGALLASADDTDVITLWDVAAREEVATFQSASE